MGSRYSAVLTSWALNGPHGSWETGDGPSDLSVFEKISKGGFDLVLGRLPFRAFSASGSFAAQNTNAVRRLAKAVAAVDTSADPPMCWIMHTPGPLWDEVCRGLPQNAKWHIQKPAWVKGDSGCGQTNAFVNFNVKSDAGSYFESSYIGNLRLRMEARARRATPLDGQAAPPTAEVSTSSPQSAPARAPPVRVQVTAGLLQQPDVVYIGRGSSELGLGPSLWGDPYKITPSRTRRQAVVAYRRHLAASPRLRSRLCGLGGARIACHCAVDEECHGDALRAAYIEECIPDRPPTDTEACRGAELRQGAVGDRQPAEPTAISGVGECLHVGSGSRRRIFQDGAGLCSPGLWDPLHRRVDSPAGQDLLDALEEQFRSLGINAKSFATQLARGSIQEDPFPSEALARARLALAARLRRWVPDWIPSGDPQMQPIQVSLLGSMLRAVGDPDWQALQEYESGVRIGVGVELPRTPAVWPAKVHWNIPGQRDASADDEFIGCTVQNYVSAVGHVDEVRATLEDQAERGQVLMLTESEARRRYGTRLTIAALGAIKKGTRSDGSTEIRVIHDGTNKVGVNSKIKVRDSIPLPMAQDLQVALRHCAASGLPAFAFTADIKEAHRLIAVAREDWALQACQLEPGGLVYINKVGTYGVASAAYWWGRLAGSVVRLLLKLFGSRIPTWLLLFADDFLQLTLGPQVPGCCDAVAVHTACSGHSPFLEEDKGRFCGTLDRIRDQCERV